MEAAQAQPNAIEACAVTDAALTEQAHESADLQGTSVFIRHALNVFQV